MKVKFWGVRGSIPSPFTQHQIREKVMRILEFAKGKDISTLSRRNELIEQFIKKEPLLVGGNTSCVEIRACNDIFILDMGSGIKKLGNELLKEEGYVDGFPFHIFINHTHWDHIQGFPFFVPAYHAQNKFIFYSPFPDIEERLIGQQVGSYFPVQFKDMPCKKEFVHLEENSSYSIGNVEISNMEMYHPGRSFGYRISCNGKSVVYATDSEYKDLSSQGIGRYIDFFKDTDLLIFDAQYSLGETIHKEDWGHSSSIIGIDISIEAGVKRLALFHHEPENTDRTLLAMLNEALRYKKINYPDVELDIFLSTEGLEVTI